ncbi:TetR/AcrR family transcriptional regulator [Mycolicibacterium bacteremicum]|uniref:TetR family transcriptional regulator n=1 Tax=Mycolicibacterium bacteremicum TaxID=564198 RepID=A0A1W9Z2U4_MYCBA|nr:TetR/AcrR family transcriptional regulator [Mycolicibacterium bacteremicum]MCV7433217.1 TetR/AcrR family transcriptional regulator [Mycolicibacterium bacteremicum]ORA06360.1 TetR family transcriptional regulator [Mycolicibacterium bacteremicum]
MADDPKPRRLTRAESKEQTRQRLLDAAAQVFARRGYAAASVEEIAETAGFSVGAVYSNFAGKDDLFSALMTDRAVNRMDTVAEIIGDAHAESQDPLRALGAMLIAMADKEIDVAVLRTEFWLHAVRNPELMKIEAAASAKTLDSVRGILSNMLERNGVDVERVSVDDFATTTLAMFGGLIRQRRIEPERVTEQMFGEALRRQIAGMPKKNESGG